MKLYFDKRLKDPTYYVQQGIRNGKKTTTKNVKSLGKHSVLLNITDDPEAYAREEIKKMNEEYRVGRVSFNLTADFNERVRHTDADSSASTWVNIWYFFLQKIMGDIELKEFFREVAKDHKNRYDCITISRFLTYARILDLA